MDKQYKFVNKDCGKVSNNIKHFIFNMLASIFLILSLIVLIGGTEILGEAYRTYDDLTYVAWLIPLIAIGVILFILSVICCNHRTKQDIEELEHDLGFSYNSIDVNRLSAEELEERYGIRDDF